MIVHGVQFKGLNAHIMRLELPDEHIAKIILDELKRCKVEFKLVEGVIPTEKVFVIVDVMTTKTNMRIILKNVLDPNSSHNLKKNRIEEMKKNGTYIHKKRANKKKDIPFTEDQIRRLKEKFNNSLVRE